MPSSLVETVASASANTYVTRAQATTFFGNRLNVSSWTSATDDQKDQALLQACRRMQDETYAGVPATTTQALAWPRYGACDRDGNEFDSDAIPQIVKDAQCELALALLVSGDDLLADTGLEGYRSVQVGPIAVQPIEGRRSGGLPSHVRRILSPVLMTSVGTASLVRG